MNSVITKRPWGTFECIIPSLQNYQVKRLVVLPGQCTSLQKHKHRAEHWYVVEGSGEAIVGNLKIPITRGSSVEIEKEEVHRLSCDASSSKSLVVIEIQIGCYLGEDDIVRLKDDYGRCLQ